MRREQRLLVDYTQFPLKLAELLHQCITSGAEGRSGFTATLQPVNSSVGSTHGVGTTSNLYNEEMDLLISEVTSFRQILHLQLRMRPPTEAALRRHLTEVVRRYQDEINSLKMTGHHPGEFKLEIKTLKIIF